MNEAGPRGTVIVCPGAYRESVTITAPGLTLRGWRGAAIDASGQCYGVGIGAAGATVTDLTVKNAGEVPPRPWRHQL